MIDVKLLGPPRVERDGALVAFDTRKALALLAHLALTDRPRPRDALADLLWPDTDPDRARGALRRTLSTLRAAVGPEFVESTRDHVRLVKGAGITVDVDRFRELRARNDLEGAVELFRGELLDGFAIRDAPDFDDWVQVESDGLRRELTATLADLARLRDVAGDHPGALRAVQRWLSLDPLHEPAHRELIRLYAASGDRAAALVQYRECVRVLSRELGVPPLAETTDLYDAVNRGTFAPPVDVEHTGPAVPQSPATPLVGRDDDLRTLRATYDAITSDGRVVVIEGEAGIGKTRLADEILATITRAGARTLVGRAYENETGLAYGPIVDAFRRRLREDDAWVADADTRSLAELARLVPEVASGRLSAGVPPFDGPGAEARFLTGIWDMLTHAVAGTRPGALFIDDAQWADDATLNLLTYGLRRLEGRRLLVVLTRRTPGESPARTSAGAFAKADGGVVLQLRRLDEDAVAEIVRAVHPGQLDADAPRRLWHTTEGVPLLLVEYLRTRDDPAGSPLPTGARELLRARLQPVSETARQVLAAAAVLGRSFDAATVRGVSGRSEEETVTALEELVRRGLVTERTVDYDFDHELLRTLVYDETSLARRRLLHSRAAAEIAEPAAAAARHLQLAGRDAAAAAAFVRAAEQARSVFANAEALSHLRAAVALGHPDIAGLQTAIGDVQTIMGDYAGALLSFETAASASSQADLPEVEHRLGRLQHRRGEYELAAAHLRAALATSQPLGAAARAGLTADLSMALHESGAADLARSLAGEAMALADEAGDARSRCQAYNVVGLLATADGDLVEALANLQSSRLLADEVGDQQLRVAVLNNLALAHRALGEVDVATELTLEALGLCAATGDRHREAALHNNLADLLHAAGRTDAAMAHLKTAVEIFAEIGSQAQPQPEIWKLVHW